MEAEEVTKLVDGVYRNILDRFNPGARQLIAAGKSYLKALHGAATASRLFNEALAKIAMNAQQSGTGDIGSALMSVVNVNKEIQEQHMNILKAFYVDLLVPLETNLEKDTKVVQHEQKKFLQQHKVRMESYQKAVSTMKKQRKKKATPENTEKELRAMTQERRRYGFVLERQCSIAKHWMAYHTTGKTVIDNNFENWQEIAASREIIPPAAYESGYSSSNGHNNINIAINNNSGNMRRLERIKDGDDEHLQSHGAQLKKSRSIDAPYGDMRTLHERENISGMGVTGASHYAQNSLPRAKSDFNLALVGTGHSSGNKHKIIEEQLSPLGDDQRGDQRPLVKALYAYMPSGENQLCFEEGDRIALFGENLRTQHFGWFPVAYTNAESSEAATSGGRRYENMLMSYDRNGGGSGSGSGGAGLRSYQQQQQQQQDYEAQLELMESHEATAEESSPTRMFGDTIKQQKKYRPGSGVNPRPGPPPTLPAPVPNGQQSQSSRMLNSSQSFCASNGGVTAAVERRKQKLLNGVQSSKSHPSGKSGVAAKTSLHSSNDSGFANEPPPQPEVDYSDEEPATQRVPIRRRADTNSHTNTVPRDVASWTLNRNFRNSVDSQIDDKSLHRLSRQSGGVGKMRYDLIASDDEILQASSGRSGEDILAGMSLWQHRDLVAAPNLEELRDRDDLERRSDEERNGTLTKSHNSSSSQEKRERKDSLTSTELYADEDENIYGPPQQQQQQQQQQQRSSYTPKSRMKIMKTIEIDIEEPTDAERMSTMRRGQSQDQAAAAAASASVASQAGQTGSTSSDPYDCIVINDHLVRKDDKMRRHHQQQQQQQQHQQMEFHTFRSSTSTTATNTLKKKQEQDSTLTRNSTASSASASVSASNNMSSSSATLERNSKSLAGNKSYGPWYDFWDQEQHGQKSASAKLKASQFATVKLRHTKTNDRSAPMIYKSVNK
ncbi:hypothetical protein M5D96_006749 [Drosophila gunungcola]|uniref:IMD domain-containing protein n=1 Tax=Drosophila gunungcola TaxID=103775 RepID=A0A9Q0BQT4_9MUSC|nr:hypothetical protein M5D96_006749 [Drosophila gunungcola]